MEPKQKRLIVVGSVLVGALIVFGLVNIIAHAGKVRLNVVVSPRDSTLLVDGHPAKAGKIWFKKGAHDLKASRQYFTNVTKHIDTNALDPKLTIYILPGADSPEAQQYLIDHPEDQQLREAAGSAKDLKVQESLQKAPLIQQLPYIAPGFAFRVDYDATSDENGNTQLTIYIEANTADAKSQALDWIRSQNVDPTKLHIVYQPNSAQSGGSINQD